MTTVDRYARYFLFALTSTAVPACIVASNSKDDPNGTAGSGGTIPNPEGPIAHDANEAWPKKSDSVPVISVDELVSACVESTACAMASTSPPDPMIAVSLCVSQLVWSAERAIPTSGLYKWSERVEYYVKCMNDHAGDCTAQASCFSGRDSSIECEEDGCRVRNASPAVTCDGNVAHVAAGEKSFDRNCALAYAECDPTSSTGCTDRPFTACPSDAEKHDRCDGNIRLGCDSQGQVSYHDCAVLGGTCQATSGGSGDCVYQATPDPECTDPSQVSPACQAGMLAACVNGRRVVVNGKTVCPS